VGVADDQLTLHTEPRKARGAQIESSELESA
jgi:hypothetical protein